MQYVETHKYLLKKLIKDTGRLLNIASSGAKQILILT